MDGIGENVMARKSKQDEKTEAVWREFLMRGINGRERRHRRLFRRLPSSHRCRYCYAPFDGISAPFVRMIFDKRPSNMNPNICNL
jgi:hypothetical protein